jgi:2-hydroxychromene-2-carboxylate isomerase
MSTARLQVTHFSDPGCPWAYSASPAFAVLRWRYGGQLEWRHVLIGLTEDAEQYVRRGYTPVRSAVGYQRFRRFGMPFALQPRARAVATSRACRAVVATRLSAPDRELAVFRALQFAWFTTPLLLDEDQAIAAALESVPGLDAAAVVGAIDDPDVVAAYEAGRAEARTAAGGPTEFQGKSAATDGPVRFTAPSVIFSRDGARLEAGGFQSIEAYDVCVANLDPTLERTPPPEDPADVVAAFPDGLTTQELAAVMTHGNDAPDRPAAEAAMVAAVADGRVVRHPLGDDALWTPAVPSRGEHAAEIAGVNQTVPGA